MANKGRLCSLIILAIAAFVAAECSSSVGGVIGSNVVGPGGFDGIEAVSRHLTPFNVGDTFNNNHLWVYATLDGVWQYVVSPGLCVISVIEDPDATPVVKNPVRNGYQLKKEGVNIIHVEYKSFQSEFNIVVNPVSGPPADSGITWEWEKP